MKLNFIFILLLTVLSTLGLQAQSNDNRFEKLADNKNIKTIVVSKTALKLAGKIDLGIGINEKDLFEKLDGLEMYSAQNKGARKKMQKEMAKVKKDSSYETMLGMTNNGKGTSIYAKPESDEIFKEFIFFKDGESDCSIIRMQGTFTVDDMQKITETME